MRSTTIASLSFAICLATACSGETGLLINTSSNENLATRIDSLRFYVGQDTIGVPGHFADDNPLEDVLLEGRNISEEPYKLLLRPSDDSSDVVIAVLAYDSQGQTIGFGRLAEPVGFISGQVLEWGVDISRTNGDVFEDDNGCVKFADDAGESVLIGRAGDQDCDGYTEEDGDCDDLNPDRHPGQEEDCTNNIDDDCNGLVDAADTEDRDQDGYFVCGPEAERDCNNDDETVHPGATEVCDGHDNDCNGLCDDGKDPDSDGVTNCGSVLDAEGQCIDMGNPDCAPNDADVFPGNREVCDGKDNDCSDGCDDASELDPDEDGYTDCGSVIGECGLSDALVDCEPENSDVHPGEQELCDGIDQDCIPDNEPERSPCFATEAGDACREGTRSCSDGVLGDVCVVVSDETLDPGFCSSYETCQDPGDPLSCVLAGDEISAQTTETCQVIQGGGERCPKNSVRIVPPDAIPVDSECTYTLVGGTQQQGYTLALINGNADPVPAASVFSCNALLQVDPSAGAGRATIAINLEVTGQAPVVIYVKLRARRLAECGMLNGLMCETWLNPVSP